MSGLERVLGAYLLSAAVWVALLFLGSTGAFALGVASMLEIALIAELGLRAVRP